MLRIVLQIIKDKNDFENIFKKLKNESRSSKNLPGVSTRDKAITREIVVRWFKTIFENFDTELIDQNKDIYVTEIENINFDHKDLAQLQIDLVCMLSRKNESYFREIIEKLIQKFHTDRKELDQEKFNLITMSLCQSIKPEKVLMEFATIFHRINDLDFVYDMIETLTFGVAASPFYKILRMKLWGQMPTDFAKDKEDLFLHLFNAWCINPVSTLTICLLSQKYELAYNLIHKFTDELEPR